jgi:hypothetical protein
MSLFSLFRRKRTSIMSTASQASSAKRGAPSLHAPEVSVLSSPSHFIPPSLPQSVDELPAYSQAFEDALGFSASCGFPSARFNWVNCDLIGEDLAPIDAMFTAAGIQDVRASAAQCLKWSHFFAPLLAQQLGYMVWVTIGQLWQDGRAVFNPSWNDLYLWSKRGIQLADIKSRTGINLHAWLTLQSGQIVELSLLSSLAKADKNAYGKFAGAVVCGREPEFLKGIRYFPMAVGQDFAHALANQSVLPLLAESAAELNEVGMVIVSDPRN